MLRSKDFAGISDLSLGTDVLVGDTMGELQRLYAAADVAFIGGSLVPHGGQNLLEACAVEVPVVFGPHMFHFEEISAMALERGAARQVHDVQGLAEAVALYFDQPDLRRAAGRAAHTLVTDNRGGTGSTTVGIQSQQDPNAVVRVQSVSLALVSVAGGKQVRATAKITNPAGTAISGATETTSIFGGRGSKLLSIVSVISIRLMSLSAIRAAAPRDKTPCVTAT